MRRGVQTGDTVDDVNPAGLLYTILPTLCVFKVLAKKVM